MPVYIGSRPLLIMKSLKHVSVSFVSIAIFIFTIVLAVSIPNLAHAIGVNATINAGPYPTGIVYDSGMKEIITANYKTSAQGSNSANRISIISTTTNKLVGQVTAIVLSYPIDLAYAPDLNEIFVSCATGSVVVISDKDNSIVANVSVGKYPVGISYDSGMKEVFVANSNSGTVSVIGSNNKVIATIPVGNTPTSVAYDSGVNEVFVTNADSDTVSVISDKTNTVVATVNVDKGPTGVAYDSGTHEIFVANTHYGTVSVISDVDNRVVATITKLSNPGNMAYDSGKGQIWVCTMGGVSVISDSSRQVIASVSTTGNSVFDVAYDSDKGQIFVTNSYEDSTSMISDSFSVQAPTQTTGSLTVTVKDSTGAAIAGAVVTSTSQPSGQTKLSITTGSDGSMTISNVAVGSYTLQALKSGYVSGTGTGTVSASSSASISITLQTQPSSGTSGSGGIPGFPIEAIMLGIILVVATRAQIVRRRS
jgi:YVTN family beta-propeller protein